MYRTSLFIRVILITFLFSLPAVLVGVVLSGVKAGAVLAVMSTFVALYVACASEREMIRAYRVGDQNPKGLQRTVEAVLKREKWEEIPKVVIYSDPSPNALTVRSLGGSGTVLLSQGLISLLNEEELRVVLRICIHRLHEKGIVFRSLCSLLTVWALRFAPKAWVNLVFGGKALTRAEEGLLSPSSIFWFLVIFPVARIFMALSRPLATKSPLVGMDRLEAYPSAVQKITQAVHLWGPNKYQGALSLYFVDPGSGQMLLPETD